MASPEVIDVDADEHPRIAGGTGAADALTLGATLQLTLDATRHDFGFELSIRKLAALLRTAVSCEPDVQMQVCVCVCLHVYIYTSM